MISSTNPTADISTIADATIVGADVAVADRNDPHAVAAIGLGIRLLEPLGDAGELGSRAARSTAPGRSSATALMLRADRGDSSQRNGMYISSNSGKRNPGGSTPTTDARAIVDDDRLADDRRIAAVAALPQAVRQHHHGLEARRRRLFHRGTDGPGSARCRAAETDPASPIRRGRARRRSRRRSTRSCASGSRRCLRPSMRRGNRGGRDTRSRCRPSQVHRR